MSEVRVEKDVEYARLGPHSLRADIYLPEQLPRRGPAVVYLHGGGWRAGDKTDDRERIVSVASHGLAVIAANYRLIDQSHYPAQIHDVKALIRYLRGHADDLGLDTQRVGLWGASAGGYLASMVALTAGNPDLEGDIGDNLDQSSAVDAVVTWFAPSDIQRSAARSELEQRVLPTPLEAGLLGVDDAIVPPQLAREASPLHHVSATAPPFLLAHGDRDHIVPIAHSATLHDALVTAGAQSTFITLGGAGHEGREFDQPAHLAMTASFLTNHLQSPCGPTHVPAHSESGTS